MERLLKTIGLAAAALFLITGLAWAADPPVVLYPINPTIGESGVDMLPTLQWNDVSAAKYKIFMHAASSPYVLGQTDWSGGSTDPSWTVPAAQALPPMTDFEWRVKAIMTDGSVVWGPPETIEDVLVPGSDPPVYLPTVIPHYWTFSTGDYGPVITAIVPQKARPTYVVEIIGQGFGYDQGRIKLVKQTPEHNKYWINGLDFGKILNWTDGRIRIVLPGSKVWGPLPAWFKVKVFLADGTKVLNVGMLKVTYGGGGTTYFFSR